MSMTAISGARNARFQVLIASDVAMLVLNVGQHQSLNYTTLHVASVS
jgi:hypothetical protein